MLANKSKPTLAQHLLPPVLLLCFACVVPPVSAQVSPTPTIVSTDTPVNADDQTPSTSYKIMDTTSVSVTDDQSTITTTDDSQVNAQSFSDEPVATPVPTSTPATVQTATTSGKKVQKFILPKVSITPTIMKKHKHETFHITNVWHWFSGFFHK